MKPSLILLHGALGSKENFSPIISGLSAHFNIHTFNFDGHGNTVSGTISIPHFAKSVLNYIEQYGLEQPYVFGYSMGGYVALKAAAQKPGAFNSIVTLGTKFNWSISEAEKEVKMLNPVKMKEKIPAFAAYLQKMHGAHWDQLVLHTADMLIQIAKRDQLTQDEIASITSKITLGLGELDNMVSLKETQDMAMQLSKADLVTLKNCPHPIEKVDSEQLIQFITSHCL